jgi:hypothetical protein
MKRPASPFVFAVALLLASAAGAGGASGQVPSGQQPVVRRWATQDPAELAAQDLAAVQQATRGFVRTAQEPSQGSSAWVPQTAIVADATRSDKKITASVGGHLSGFVWGLSVSAPADDDQTKTVQLADLKGLRRATTGKLALAYLAWHPTADQAAERQFCQGYWGAHPPKSVLDSIAVLRRNPAAVVERVAADSDTLVSRYADQHCQSSLFPDSVRPAFEESGRVNYGHPLAVSIQLEGGVQHFTWADTATTKVESADRAPMALSFGAGLYVPGLRTMFIVAGRVESADKGADAQQYCVPVGSGLATRCQSIALAAPSHQATSFAQIEVRHFLSEFVGLSPRVTVALSGPPKTGLEVPILLRRGDDHGFNSGITLGWRSDQPRQVILSAFVGQVFGLSVLPE